MGFQAVFKGGGEQKPAKGKLTKHSQEPERHYGNLEMAPSIHKFCKKEAKL